MIKKESLIIIASGFVLIFLTIFFLERDKVKSVSFTGPLPEWGEGATAKRKYPLGSMVRVNGGEYIMGDDTSRSENETTKISVKLNTFEIDRYPVTNKQFTDFVFETDYVTDAEKHGGSWVYRAGKNNWKYMHRVNWRHPLGPDSSIKYAWDHPVVHITWNDANAYAKWAGKRLPTESEWEVATRAGKNAWETNLKNPAIDASANVWQGNWPEKNKLKDRYYYTSPVGAFEANELGIYDTLGNVWEWTYDWYTENSAFRLSQKDNPIGPSSGTSKVVRGGSWACAQDLSDGFYPGYRGKTLPDNSFSNIGFRCVRDFSY